MFNTVRKDERIIQYDKNGAFKRLLLPGEHYTSFSQIVKYRVGQYLDFDMDLEILLEDKKLREALLAFDVADDEVAVYTKNGNFMSVISEPGQYAIFKGPYTQDIRKFTISEPLVEDKLAIYWARKGLFGNHVYKLTVEAHEEALLFIGRKFSKKIGPGEYFFWSAGEYAHIERADKRIQQIELSGQELLTKDKIAIRITFIVNYRVADIEKAFGESSSYSKQLYSAAQLALRDYIGSKTLDEILEGKDKIAGYVSGVVDKNAGEAGLELISTGAKDVILPGEIKDILNQVLVAEKKAQASVITRREETASMRNMLNTARLMDENKTLFKLREMEHLERIAENVGTIEMSAGGGLLKQLRKVAGGKKD